MSPRELPPEFTPRVASYGLDERTCRHLREIWPLIEPRMPAMLDELIRGYPAEEQPPGSWWLPSTYGGSAPTIEEAKEMELAERRARAERRRQKAKEKAAKKR